LEVSPIVGDRQIRGAITSPIITIGISVFMHFAEAEISSSCCIFLTFPNFYGFFSEHCFRNGDLMLLFDITRGWNVDS
jgi:hypothetical protein